MRIVSWNVNGLRACAAKGFDRFPGVVEGRHHRHSGSARVSGATRREDAFAARLARALRGGGTRRLQRRGRLLARQTRQSRNHAARRPIRRGRPPADRAVRPRLALSPRIFPKGSGKERDNSRVPYKLDFYAALFDRVQKLKRRGPVFVIGDYNTAHEAIDLARPKTNEKTSGFLPEERAEMTRWIDAGWVDTFRARHPGEAGHYTWWRQWGGAREKNVGGGSTTCSRRHRRRRAYAMRSSGRR